MKSLFKYPASYPPRLDACACSAARFWFLGGLLWLGVALAAFLGAAIKVSWAPGWASGSPATSIGVLRQIGECALLYGWGLPSMFGISLLLSAGEGFRSDSLDKAGAWIWHFCIAWGLIALGLLKGSGIAGMPFPAYLWPVLILAALPVCRSRFNEYFSFRGEISLPRNIIFSSHLLALLLLTGGFVYVFLAGTHPYYVGLAAKSVQSGLALAVLGGFALVCADSRSGFVTRIPLAAGTGLYILCTAFIMMIEFAAPGGPWNFYEYAPDLTYLARLVIVLSILMLGARKKILSGLVALILVSLWGRMDLWMLLLMILFGGLGSSCSRVTAVLLPRCRGCDWISRDLMKKTMKAFRIWLVFWLVVVTLDHFNVTRGWMSGSAWIYGFAVNMMLFLALVVYAVFGIQILLVWLGGGRLNAQPALNADINEGKEAGS